MTRLLRIVGLTGILASSSAVAESAKEAMQTFGMIGTWSLNCATSSFRVVYGFPMSGPPTLTMFLNGQETAISEVQDAVTATEAKIKITYLIKSAPQGTPSWGPLTGEIWEAVYEKIGNKFRPLSVTEREGAKATVRDGFYYVNQKTGGPTLPFEKCLN
jgi:hypothetical protein